MTGNPRIAMVCDTPYLQNEIGDPRFLYVFILILSFSTYSQSFKKSVRGKFWAQTDVSFSCVCPVIDHEFRHNIVNVAVDPTVEQRINSEV